MKNLTELIKYYENKFISICKKIEKYGMMDNLENYNTCKEVCFELSIDTDEIEEKYISRD